MIILYMRNIYLHCFVFLRCQHRCQLRCQGEVAASLVLERDLFLFARTPFMDLSNLLYFICISFGIFLTGRMGDRLTVSGVTAIENLQPMLLCCTSCYLYLFRHAFVNVSDMAILKVVGTHSKPQPRQ